MKIHCNIFHPACTSSSFTKQCPEGQTGLFSSHSCQNAFAFLGERSRCYSPGEKPATVLSWCYDRKQIKHSSHSAPNEPPNQSLEIDSGHIKIIDPLNVCHSTPVGSEEERCEQTHP